MAKVEVKLVKQPGRNYELRYRCAESGRMKSISTGTKDRRKAQTALEELQSRFILGLKLKKKQESATPLNWQDFREMYRTKKLQHLELKTYQAAESRLDICEAILQPTELGDLDQDALEQLQVALKQGVLSRFNKPRSDATVASYMRDVTVALNWAFKRGWLQSVPSFVKLPSESVDMKGRPLAGEEVDRMLAAAEAVVGATAAPSWRYIMQGLLTSGFRLSEAMSATWDQPNSIRPDWESYQHPVIRIPAKQKNKRFQEIPMVPWFEKHLKQTKPRQRYGYIYNPMSVKYGAEIRLGTDRVGKVISKIGERAGILVNEDGKFASAHDLRRTFAQRLIVSDIARDDVRQLLRHASLSTTERYYLQSETQAAARRIRTTLKESH